MAKVSIIFASTNDGKIGEFKKRLSLDADSFEVIGLKDLGYTVPECEETGKTFRENATLKVAHTRKYLHARHRRSIIIGDDSGMSIRALNGEPGVHTRRWTGKVMSDEEIISHCLNQLKNHRDRSADYVTAYALLESSSDVPYIVQEKTYGEILDMPRLESYVEGIPFRSLFYIPTAAAMFHEARELPDSAKKDMHIGHEIALDKCRSFIKTSFELDRLRNALTLSWSSETSYHSNLWSRSRPSTGQCAVSALLVQDLLGGEIIKSTAVTKKAQESHFFNRLLDGWDVDLTSSQFPDDTHYEDKVIANRDDVLSYASTVKRYDELRNSFYHNLQYFD